MERRYEGREEKVRETNRQIHTHTHTHTHTYTHTHTHTHIYIYTDTHSDRTKMRVSNTENQKQIYNKIQLNIYTYYIVDTDLSCHFCSSCRCWLAAVSCRGHTTEAW